MAVTVQQSMTKFQEEALAAGWTYDPSTPDDWTKSSFKMGLPADGHMGIVYNANQQLQATFVFNGTTDMSVFDALLTSP